MYNKSAFFALLWHCVDDNKRLGVRPAWFWCVSGYRMDDRGVGYLYCVFMVALYTGEADYSASCNSVFAGFISQG